MNYVIFILFLIINIILLYIKYNYNNNLFSFKTNTNMNINTNTNINLNTIQSYKRCINIDKNFIEWFIGFIDGEGNFSIFKDKNNIRFKFVINLHIDDLKTLNIIKNKLEIGNVNPYPNKYYCSFTVYNSNEIEYLIQILDLFPLKTKKHFDYNLFKLMWTKKKILNKELLIEYYNNNIKEKMNNNLLIDSDILWRNNDILINKNWLIGFTEAEGTFGIKGLTPYFQIAQHKISEKTLEKIKLYLNTEFNIKMNSILNKKTNVISLSINNIDDLYTLISIFENNMYTRKAIDFSLWKKIVLIYKLGYHMIPNGRELIVLISDNINKKRYSNVMLKDIWDQNLSKINELYTKILEIKPLIDINSNKSHTQLMLEYSNKNKVKQTIYIYLNDKLIEGSPFTTYSSANLALNLKNNSRTVFRYINTNKLYKNKYLITSKIKK